MYAVGRCLAGEVAIGIGEVGKYIDVICFFVLAELDNLLILTTESKPEEDNNASTGN